MFSQGTKQRVVTILSVKNISKGGISCQNMKKGKEQCLFLRRVNVHTPPLYNLSGNVVEVRVLCDRKKILDIYLSIM